MLYTIYEIAEMFKVDHMTVRRWIDTGKLEAIQINQTIRVTEPSYQKFLEDAKKEIKK